jgi:RimJ/RimL family protein N-acetyltransferase
MKTYNSQLIQRLKNNNGIHNYNFCITIGSPILAFLRPISTNIDHLNHDDIKRLTDWRNQYKNAFLTEFIATEAQTKKWLVEYVGKNPNKILFMLETVDGKTIGYMGIDYINEENSYAEADAIVRGIEYGKGLMKIALHALLKWTKYQLGIKHIWVRVLSDNKALHFYTNVGFTEVKRIPLSKIINEDMIIWVEDNKNPNPNRYIVYMKLNE